jgi:hypothetical protein
MSVSQFDFNTFRVEECNTKMPIVNWKTPKPNAITQAVDSWKRHVKPNTKDYSPFKNEACWICRKKRFITMVAAQGLRVGPIDIGTGSSLQIHLTSHCEDLCLILFGPNSSQLRCVIQIWRIYLNYLYETSFVWRSI